MTRKAKSEQTIETLIIKQVGSPIARNNIQRLNLIGLGLNKIGREVTLQINPSVMGMIKKVKHLVKIEKSK